jgi:hypothetical protein
MILLMRRSNSNVNGGKMQFGNRLALRIIQTVLTQDSIHRPSTAPHSRWRGWRSYLVGRRRVWSIFVVGLLLVAGATAAVEYPRKKPPVPIASRFPMSTPAMRAPGRMRVLFLGNSLTEYNGGLALIMEQLATSAGIKPVPVFDEVTRFGATWAQLWDVTRAREMIRQGSWDFVVLQDYSTAPTIYRSEMDFYGRRFSQEARAVGARPVFFMTWPHDDQIFLQNRIAGAYIRVAQANDGIVAPVGYAWQYVLIDRPDIVLYDSREHPRKHPTPAGSYLAACVFYSIFFHHSPHGLTGRIVEGTNVFVDLPAAEALYLQDAAWKTVADMGALAATRPAGSRKP